MFTSNSDGNDYIYRKGEGIISLDLDNEREKLETLRKVKKEESSNFISKNLNKLNSGEHLSFFNFINNT